MKKYSLVVGLLAFLMACRTAPSDKGDATWEEKVVGVWNISEGKPEKMNLTNELHFRPKLATIEKMGRAELPINKEDIHFEIVDGKTYIRFPLDNDEKLFGLELNFKTVEQRGRIMRLHVD